MTSAHPTIPRRELTRCKAALESKLEMLLKDSRGKDDLRIEYQADPLDQVTSNSNRDLTVGLLNHSAQLIRDTRLALAKIEEEGYGICERCDEPIAQKRLMAAPWARLCVTCQSRSEAAAANGKLDGDLFEDVA